MKTRNSAGLVIRSLIPVATAAVVVFFYTMDGAQSAQQCDLHTPSGPERREVLDTLRQPVMRDLGQPVQLKVSKIRACGSWAFVIAEPIKPGGGALPWAHTICKGDVSHLVGALEQRDSTGSWAVKEYALCPTDVAWENWPEKYGAPQSLFGE